MGYEKTRFWRKNKSVFLLSFWDEASGPETLYFTAFSKDFPRQKSTLSGPSWASPHTKTELWCKIGDDFRGVAWEYVWGVFLLATISPRPSPVYFYKENEYIPSFYF